MFFSKEIRLPGLYIFGDSSVVINWAKERPALTILDLEASCINIKHLIASLSYIDYKHVYKLVLVHWNIVSSLSHCHLVDQTGRYFFPRCFRKLPGTVILFTPTFVFTIDCFFTLATTCFFFRILGLQTSRSHHLKSM